MYEHYWQLTRNPFEGGVDPRAYYPAETHQGALAKLRYAIDQRRGAALVTGPSGVGKTLLLRVLAEHLGPECHPLVHLVFPQMPAAELLSYLAAELDSALDERMGSAGGANDNQRENRESSEPGVPSIEASVRRIQRRLAQNAAQGRHAVLIVDEAHLLEGRPALEALRLLLNFESAAGTDATLVLVGQTSLTPIIGRMPQLEERLGVKCALRPLELAETMSYIQHRLAVAGGERPIFDSSATVAVHRLSHGLPRQINRLCDLALLVGFAEDQRAISAADVEAVCQDLAGAVG